MFQNLWAPVKTVMGEILNSTCFIRQQCF
jgi:hypothetical protein